MNLQPQRRYLAYTLLLVLFFMLLVPGANQLVYAQNKGDVTLTAQVGFAGSCKDNRWIPIRVTVENKGADLQGRVQVAYQNGKGGQTGYGVDLSLPGTSRKEFFLYLRPDGYFQKLNINLTVENRIVETTPLNATCIAAESLLIGLLTDTPAAFGALSSVKGTNGITRVFPLKLTDLPDRSQGWESLDALVVSGVDMGSITEPQRKALKIWLARGGKLLIAGGPKWQSTTSGLEDFLPLDVNKTNTVDDLSSVQQYFNSSVTLNAQGTILAVGQPTAKASVLITQGGLPVLSQKQVGFGRVYLLGADPVLQPFSTWADMGLLYQELLGAASARPVWMNPAWESSSANQALAAMPALGLPPTIYVLCLLGIYTLVVGPINYFVLRAIKRQEWAWISIPGFVFVFTLVAYFSGYLLRGAKPLLNRLAIVEAWEGVDQADARGLVGIYSPGRTKYTLQAGESFLAYPFDSNTQSLQADNGWLSLQQGTQISLPDVLVESSGMKSALVSGSVPALAITDDLELTLYDGNPILSGSITNNSPYTIKNATLITTDAAKDLGNISPGETRKVQISMRPNPKGIEIYDFQGQSMYTNYSNDDLDDEVVRHNALMRTMLSYQRESNKVTSGIYLTGWLDEDILSTSVQGQAFDSLDTTFYMLHLSPNIKTQPGDVKLTPGMFTWTSSDPIGSPYALNQYAERIIDNGYVLNFKLATPLQYTTVKSLTLSLGQVSYGNATTPVKNAASIALWDRTTFAWVQFDDLIWGDNNIPDPARFVGPGEEIRMKIAPPSLGQTAIAQSGISESYFTLVVQP